MFLGHSATWWGIFLSAAAIILTIPLSVVGNLVTPALKNWWAARSEASLKKRIANLEAMLARCEQIPPISDAAHIGLVSMQFILAGLGMLTLLGQLLLQFTIEIAQASSPPASAPKSLPSAIAQLPLQAHFVFALSLMITFILMFAAGRIGGFLQVRSPYARRTMASSLEKLRAKL